MAARLAIRTTTATAQMINMVRQDKKPGEDDRDGDKRVSFHMVRERILYPASERNHNSTPTSRSSTSPAERAPARHVSTRSVSFPFSA